MTGERDGVLVVDKPEGPTSHDVVAVARRVLGTRQVGHTGTLDPMATGVLALVVGRATRLARFLAADTKSYDAQIRLGVETDSWDRTGTVTREPDPAGPWPLAASVAEALRRLTGPRDQVPPPFSAKMVDGVRAYQRARRGEVVELRPASVVLHEALFDYEPPALRVRIRCSPGFYVRSLAHEIGVELGCGACLEVLRRTASGSFTLESALTLDMVATEAGAAAASLVPLEALLPELPAVTLSAGGLRRALNGNQLRPGDFVGCDLLEPAAESVRVFSPEGRLVAVARPAGEPGFLHPVVVLK